MVREEREKDFFSQWFEFQRSFLSQWADSFGKTPQPWTEGLRFWQGAMTPYADFFSAWSKMVQETIGKTAGQAEEGLGRTVLYRTLGASNVFVVLNEFWAEALSSLPELYQAKGDAVKSREIFERWVQRYNKVFEHRALRKRGREIQQPPSQGYRDAVGDRGRGAGDVSKRLGVSGR